MRLAVFFSLKTVSPEKRKLLFWGVCEGTKKERTYGFPSLPEVDKAIAFGSRKPAETASSNHI